MENQNQTHYPSGREFQRRILAYFLQNPEAAGKYHGDVLRSEFFDWDIHQGICSVFIKFVFELKSGFSKEALTEELVNTHIQSKPQEWLNECAFEASELLILALPDRKYIEDKA